MVCEGITVENVGLEKFPRSEVIDEVGAGEPAQEEDPESGGGESPKSLEARWRVPSIRVHREERFPNLGLVWGPLAWRRSLRSRDERRRPVPQREAGHVVQVHGFTWIRGGRANAR